MRNINFDNPYLLLLALPALALLLTPFFIAIRKENCSRSVITSMILHLLITVGAAFAVAGTNVQTILTETAVYVVADVSYSANKNLGQVDDYIRGVEDAMPTNSKMGVIVFGRDYQLKTELGGEFETVTGSNVDDSATNIADALKYAGTLFKADTIKRVVLITDGKQTDGQATEEIISAVEGLHAQDVKIDAIYLNDNLVDGQNEAQISGVDFTKATYLNHEVTADALVQSSYNTEAIITLERKSADENEYKVAMVRTAALTKGFNVINFDLDTSEEGVYDYRLTLEAEGDVSSYNNEYDFTQSVEGSLQMMALTSSVEDIVTVAKRYASKAGVEAYLRRYEEKFNSAGRLTETLITYQISFAKDENGAISAVIRSSSEKDAQQLVSSFPDYTVTVEKGAVEIPYTVEALCVFDEIILSEFDIRLLDNDIAFIQNLQTVVSDFGKSLLVAGDMQLHNQNEDDPSEDKDESSEDASLVALQKMLPVQYSPSEQDPKLYGIIFDASRSMETLWHFQMAKLAAIQLVNMLSDDDYVTVVAFAGDVTFEQLPVRVGSNRTEIIQSINALEVRQGTYLGAALKKTLEFMNSMSFYKEQVMLITDGKSHTAEADNPAQIVKDMRAASINTSVINTGSKSEETNLRNLTIYGGGSYYYVETEAEIASVMLEEVADEVTESVIEKKTHVKIKRYTDDLLDGVSALPNVYGFLTTTQKASAINVLSVDYQKDAGGWVEVPLYSYWGYGEGKVAAFTSKLSGEWAKDWEEESGQQFFDNILKENTPKEKNNKPFRVALTSNSSTVRVEVSPHIIDSLSSITASVTLPNGETLESQELLFDSSRYYWDFPTEQTGRYVFHIIYARGAMVYETDVVFNLCYQAEYDSFTSYDASTLHKIVRHRGTVSEDGNVDLSNDAHEVETYTKYFTVPLMAAVIAMFILDVIVRKLRWVDIKGLFKKTQKGGKTK